MAEVKMKDAVADQLREKYPSNSRLSRPEPERDKVAKVTNGKVSLQKDTLWRKVKKLFMPADIKDIWDYALTQLLVPGLKTGALALVEMALFGEVTKRRGIISSNRTNYTYISSGGNRVESRAPSLSQKDRATHNFQNIVFESYEDAENVISTLIDLVDRYGSARVLDFYEAAGVDSDWASTDWGWKSFNKLESRKTLDGYVIDITPPVPLN